MYSPCRRSDELTTTSCLQVDVTGEVYQGQLPTAETYMAQLAGGAVTSEALQMEQLLVPQVSSQFISLK